MKKTEKQHNAPPMPAHRLNATQSIAKHFHAIGLPGHGPGPGLRPSEAARRADAKALRRTLAQATANPPYSRQEAKKRTEEALMAHREGKPATAPLAKKRAVPRKSALDLLRAKLPKRHTDERIDFAKRMYEGRVQTRRDNQPVLLSAKSGSVTSYDPRPEGSERCELYFPQRGTVPVGY